MHRVYVSFGLDPSGFWRITPREMAARLEGARRRLDHEQDARAWHAWHVAALSRADPLPDLASLMTKSEQPKDQTPDEQVIAIDRLFLAWGGDVADLAQAREKGEIPDVN